MTKVVIVKNLKDISLNRYIGKIGTIASVEILCGYKMYKIDFADDLTTYWMEEEFIKVLTSN